MSACSSSGLIEIIREVDVKCRSERIVQTSACSSSGLDEMERKVEVKKS